MGTLDESDVEPENLASLHQNYANQLLGTLSTADPALNHLREIEPAISSPFDAAVRTSLVNSTLPEMLRREVEHRGLLREDASLATRLIGWIETT